MAVECASYTRVYNRCIEKLNIGTAAYDGTINPRNKTRNAGDIAASVIEAGLMIVQTLASIPNEYRANFYVETAIAYGAQVPAHLGKIVGVKVQKYDTADFTEARQRNYEKIESYRQTIDGLDNNAYSNIPHDQIGSPLGGFYDIWNDTFYFTGNAAKITVAIAGRNDVYNAANASLPTPLPTSKIPVFMEPIWTKLAFGNTLKTGEGGTVIAIADRYYNQGMSDLNEFKGGKRVFAEADEPAPAMEVHQW